MAESIGVIKLPINRLHIELTNICNFSCEFCPDSKMKRQRGMMPVEMPKAILEEVRDTKVVKMVLFHIMGEPTLYPNLIDVVEYANNKGIDTCLTTNGSRLDERLLDELVQAGIDRIIISLQTPDEKTFKLRGARGINFDEYVERIIRIAKRFLSSEGKTRLTISFLSSPLRRLIIPIFPEVSIADTAADLKKYLILWADKIMRDTPVESRFNDVLEQIKRIWTLKENTIIISNRVSLHTRVMGDWAVHFDKKNVNAIFGYCPGIQENFGILWNGDYTFCCTDYDGATATHNFHDTSIREYLMSEPVQNTVKAFNRFRVVHPYCKQCLGDRNILNALVKQIGSIGYFKWMKRN
ncbi:MAG: radical SAM protein [Nitrospirae bacterium]|nr:radical SAM protein [Nitrospirota bacterium]